MIRVIHNDASVVTSKTNEVVVLGPEDVDISMTPDAAVRTAGELLEKAAEAVGKKTLSDADCKTMAARNGKAREDAVALHHRDKRGSRS